MAQWQAEDWPGNVRELRNFAERLALGIVAAPAPANAPAAASNDAMSLPQQVEHHERELIVQALAAVDGNVGLAADNLLVPRKTLYDKLKKYQIGTGRANKDGER